MDFIEQIILFQNKTELDFEKEKSLKSISKYILAFSIFILSNIYAGISLPFRLLFKRKIENNNQISDIDKENFEKILKRNELIILDFWAEWCGPCVMMNSVISKFVNNTHNIHFGKVNVDKNKELIKRFDIKGLPQFLLIKNGVEIKRHSGAMTLAELESFSKQVNQQR